MVRRTRKQKAGVKTPMNRRTAIAKYTGIQYYPPLNQTYALPPLGPFSLRNAPRMANTRRNGANTTNGNNLRHPLLVKEVNTKRCSACSIQG